MSKIQFWKQFTTRCGRTVNLIQLYSICQRYNFESNLQQQKDFQIAQSAVFYMSKIQFWKQFTTTGDLFMGYQRCIRYVKDTILKAIYNTPALTRKRASAVFDMSKIQFWKQFTTFYDDGYIDTCCIRYVKDTILKAIYNIFLYLNLITLAVFDMSKIQFWKQFTTVRKVLQGQRWLYSICQRYNFESNLQQKENMN